MKSIHTFKQCTSTIGTILPRRLTFTGARLTTTTSTSTNPAASVTGYALCSVNGCSFRFLGTSTRSTTRFVHELEKEDRSSHRLTTLHNHYRTLCFINSTPKRQMSQSSWTGPFGKDLVFRQLLEYKSYTYTYLLADADTNEAVIIDPVIETVDRDVKLVHDLGLKLIYAANTHVHADHVTGSGSIKKLIPTCKSVIAEVSKAKADVKVNEGDLIKFGKFKLEVRSTPGHTDGCITFVLHEKGLVFTGDALLIRGCGRTDFQQGNPGSLYDSIHKKILSLPQSFYVFPAHDYTGQTMSTVGEELRYNPRLTKPKNEFVEIMKNLNLPYPKQIDKALPANMVCGVFDVPESS
ncbi:persulfide dioxygenase ETHE1, mitochondrial-like isoform X1 [Biomphalaria glabrata]|uniref:Persulfide dioxygenase ETHE1, mitochondrial n=1 Tax=Biomphalaria glabrata TaxID=6526 RepID=A0A9U8E942_BIOGL|nr:persulfide dioxygenase ETHE1, mitochondrial-like isoform X1 [Biomphalaria glabrata]